MSCKHSSLNYQLMQSRFKRNWNLVLKTLTDKTRQLTYFPSQRTVYILYFTLHGGRQHIKKSPGIRGIKEAVVLFKSCTMALY